MWLADTPYSEQDPRRIPRTLFDELTGALGERNAPKSTLVSALLARLVLTENRPPLPPELAAFWEPIERTDICHYAFPANARKMIEAIGKLEVPPDFEGCGSCGARQRELAQEHFQALCRWLRGEQGKLTAVLRDRTPVKAWLVACLAKTLKEHAGLPGKIPLPLAGRWCPETC